MIDHALDAPGSPGMLHEEGRRDFLFVATGAVGAVTVAASIWPLIDALNPSADVLSLASVEIDLSGVEIGQRITVKWRGRPVFIWRRSEADIAEARATPLEDLKDPLDQAYENPNLGRDVPALDQNRTMDEAGEWLVVIGICTHLGCVPLGQSGTSVGDWGGWFCPCHGSHYDRSGRIRRGPAPRNLDIPPYVLEGEMLRIG
ncbi:MAG: ubiquinol-cytochrome c reductase iron-sulfur subunit [Thermohalobaculum sp.]|nr:ubiquinol-cytochrome c reductase iron-sulfur subunit [Thermohalobaculum sp.]